MTGLVPSRRTQAVRYGREHVERRRVGGGGPGRSVGRYVQDGQCTGWRVYRTESVWHFTEEVEKAHWIRWTSPRAGRPFLAWLRGADERVELRCGARTVGAYAGDVQYIQYVPRTAPGYYCTGASLPGVQSRVQVGNTYYSPITSRANFPLGGPRQHRERDPPAAYGSSSNDTPITVCGNRHWQHTHTELTAVAGTMARTR